MTTDREMMKSIYLQIAAHLEGGPDDVSPWQPGQQPPAEPPISPEPEEPDDAPDDGVEEPDDGNDPPEPPDHDDGS